MKKHRLRYEFNSAFDHTLWDRFQLLSILNTNRKLNDADYTNRAIYKYSFVQDAFYSLLGCVPTGTQPKQSDTNKNISLLWNAITTEKEFTQLQKVFFSNNIGRIVSTLKLAQAVENYIPNLSRDGSEANDETNEEIEEQEKAEQEEQSDKQTSQEQRDQETQEEQETEENLRDFLNDEDSENDSSKKDGKDNEDNEDNDQSSSDGSGQSDNGEDSTDDSEDSEDERNSSDGDSQQESENDPGSEENQSDSNGDSSESEESDNSEESEESESNGNGNRTSTDSGDGNQTQEEQEQEQQQSVSYGPINKELTNKELRQSNIQEMLSELSEDINDSVKAVEALKPYFDRGNSEEILRQIEPILETLDLSLISQYLGFVENSARGAKRHNRGITGEFTKYRNSGWSQRLHPMDSTLVASGDIRGVAKLAQRNLRRREMDSKRAMGRGPVLVLRDESQSMTWNFGIDQSRHEHALALEISLAHTFNRENRDLVSIAWNDSLTREYVYGVDDFSQHINDYLGGSTDLTRVMRKAMETLEDYVDGADILIITDGEFGQQHETDKIRNFKHKDGRIWLILIGEESPKEKFEELKENIPFADGIVHVKDIMDVGKMDEIIEGMNRQVVHRGTKVMV